MRFHVDQQGCPKFFKVDTYLDAVEMMIDADEVERAIWMLDNMPGYYRDQVPERAIEIRETLHKKTWTAIQYAGLTNRVPLDVALVDAGIPLRGKLVDEIIEAFNTTGKCPHIMDLAPGGFWLPEFLKLRKRDFTYSFLSLTQDKDEQEKPDGPIIFVCFEVIEHLTDTSDIYRNYLKMGMKADVFMLSTPLYTINGGLDNWRDRDLGHLRTYTPQEFMSFAEKYFKGCKWELVMGEEMVLTGVRA